MKKLFLLFVGLFAIQMMVVADEDKPVEVSQLPQKAQQFIQQNFASSKVALAKMDTEFLDKSYDVIFTNGNKVEFDRAGNWTEVDCKQGEVPTAIVPDAIRQQISSTYPDATIRKIERDRKYYEVKLSNGWELEYDSKFRLVDMDK